MSDLGWILLIASTVGVANALVGTLLVLRKSAMMGDAISHTVLLGIVGAFLITGSRDLLPFMVGAVFVGLVTALIVRQLTMRAHVPEDASIGVTFTMLFALAVLLISVYTSSIDLDQECVLHGELALAVFHRWTPLGIDLGPRALWLPLVACIGVLAVLVLGYHRLQLLLFDPISCQVHGISVHRWESIVMALSAFVIVASFEAVGSILVLALLVVPAAIALLFVRSLWATLVGAVVVSIVASILGVLGAVHFDVSIAGSIASVVGVLFFGALLIRTAFQKRPEAGPRPDEPCSPPEIGGISRA